MTVRRDPPTEAELNRLKARFFACWDGIRGGAAQLGPNGLQQCAIHAREMRVTAAQLAEWRREWSAKNKR